MGHITICQQLHPGPKTVEIQAISSCFEHCGFRDVLRPYPLRLTIQCLLSVQSLLLLRANGEQRPLIVVCYAIGDGQAVKEGQANVGSGMRRGLCRLLRATAVRGESACSQT